MNEQALIKRIEELEAIVKKYPTTANGVPIVPGMALYRYTGSATEYADLRLVSQLGHQIMTWDAYYSTRVTAKFAALMRR